MDIFDELAQGEKLTQIANTANPLSTASSVSTPLFDMQDEPTLHTRDPLTVNVDHSATLDAVPSEQGTSGERQSIQLTTASESEMAVETLVPPSREINSMVQPGGQGFDSQLPPELPGTLTTGQKIDGGHFADVCIGEWENTDGIKTVVAIKYIRCTDGADDARFRVRIRREAVIWRAADHPNILRFIGYSTVEGVPGVKLVSPWCKHGNLTRYISNTPGITRAEKIDLLYGAGCGLAHLHSRTPVIVHADIKPSNIIIQDNFEAALCDFGLSRIILDLGNRSGLTTTGSNIGGTAGYQAKELLEGEIPTTAGDVYAFGGLILAAMSGRDPLWNRDNENVRILATCKEQIPVPKEHPGLTESDPLWSLLRQCWSINPANRPPMDIVHHELVNQLKGPVPLLSERPLPLSGTLTMGEKPVGCGGFGDVYRGQWNHPDSDAKLVAITDIDIDVRPPTAPLDTEVEPTSNTRHLPTIIVDDSATLGAVPSDPRTSGERQSIQPTAPSDSGVAVHLLAPPDGETNSLVQPGVQVFDSQLPPPLPGTLTITISEKKDGGQFFNVYVGELEHPGGEREVVAIKCIRCTDGADEQRFQTRIRREAVIWKAADHPNILRFIGYQFVEGIPWLVSPWCQYRSLTRYIDNTPSITRAEKIDLLCGAARGLLHLHSLKPIIVHGDIKPDNVVIKDNLEAALCDFGISKINLDFGKASGLTTTGNKVGGTAGYQAKELLEGNLATPAADVYAFGGLILAAMSGLDPLWNRKNDAARIVATCMDQIPVPKEHPGLPEDDPLWSLLRECWSADPEERPTMDTVLQKLVDEKDLTLEEGPLPLLGTLTMDEKPVGRGGFGHVYRGKWNHPVDAVKLVAIKRVRPPNHRDQSLTKRIIQEIQTRQVEDDENSNIWPVIGHQVIEGDLMLVSLWCENGNLATYIAKNAQLERVERLKLLCDAACGLTRLHSRTPLIVHGDIKPTSFVIQDDYQAALCDFGLSRIISGFENPSCLATTGNRVGGTAGYQTEEFRQGNPRTAEDVYAFGGLILATMSGRDPLWNSNNDGVRIFATCTGQIPVPKEHPGLPEADPLWSLLRQCWSVDPANRPPMAIVHQELVNQLKGSVPLLWELPLPLPGTLTMDKEPGGRGGFADVYRGGWRHTDGGIKTVAIKRVRPPTAKDHKDEYQTFNLRAIREIAIWRKAAGQSSNILPFIGHQVVEGALMLVSPWSENGNLAIYIDEHPELTRRAKLKLLHDVARGLEYLHSLKPPILHGDIKPQNVIVQNNLEGALTDFGISRFILDIRGYSVLTTSDACGGTRAYEPKEILRGDPPTTAADAFAFGGLILATMSGNPPFWKDKWGSVVILAISQDKMPNYMDHPGLPQEDSIWDLLQTCWSPKPASRPSAVKLLKSLEAEMVACEVAACR